MPKRKKIEERADEGDEHHGDADGVGVKLLGEMPGPGSEDHGADANEEADAVKGDEGAADALEEGQDEAGPVEPGETRGSGGEGFVARDVLGLYGFGHARPRFCALE